MTNNPKVDFNPWFLTPCEEEYKVKNPAFISLGKPDDGLPPIRDDINWVSRLDQRIPVQVERIGTSEWCPGTQVERKISGQLSIEFVLQGKAELTVNDKKFDLQKNDVYILHLDEHHIYRALPPERFLRKCLFLQGKNSRRLIKQTGLDTVSRVRLSPEKAEYFREKLEHIDLINRAKQDGFIQDISSETYALILMLSKEVYGYSDQPVLPDKLIIAMKFVLDNLNLELHPESIARSIPCSVGYLTKLFKRHLNTSPHHWLERQKIAYAIVLLQTSRMKIYEIAEELKYCDQFHFAKVFKRVIGISPTAFRKRWRKKTGGQSH